MTVMNHEEVCVCWIQDYDISYPIGVVTIDKFEDFIKSYEDKIVKPNKNENIESVEIINQESSITWRLRYNDEYIKKTYYFLSDEQIIENKKDSSWGCSCYGFNYELLKINQLY